MKRVWVAALGLVCSSALGQGLQPVSYSAKQQTPPPPALRAVANLVVIDVTVKDASHHPIKGLKQEDFVLLEDKAAQTLRNFEEHTSAEIVPAAAMPVLPAGVFTNITSAPAKGPLNILLLDKLDTALSDQSIMRAQLLKFLDAAKPGTRIAVFELSDRLRLLQGFTEDRALLKAVVTNSSTLKPVLSDAPIAYLPDGKELTGTSDPGPVGEVPSITAEKWRRSRQRSLTAEDTMRAIAMYVSGVPGRKNLLWFSGNFPLYFLGQPGDPMKYPPSDASLMRDFRKMADLLAASQVSMYPIDVRGVVVGSTNDIGQAMGGSDFDRTWNRDEAGAMTGGRAFHDRNDIDVAVAEAIEDGSNYYTLTYTPANKNWDGRHRNITVKLADGRMAELSYRQGYSADDPNKPIRTSIFGKPQPKDAPPTPMQTALMLGMPESSQVAFVVRVLPEAAKSESTLAPGNEGSKDLKGPYQRYTVRLGVDVRTLLTPKTADGTGHASLELVSMVYDRNGHVVNTVGKPMKAEIASAQEQQILKSGLSVEMEISVPVKGDFTLRVAVHDLNNDHVGAVEVPVSAVKNLAAK